MLSSLCPPASPRAVRHACDEQPAARSASEMVVFTSQAPALAILDACRGWLRAMQCLIRSSCAAIADGSREASPQAEPAEPAEPAESAMCEAIPRVDELPSNATTVPRYSPRSVTFSSGSGALYRATADMLCVYTRLVAPGHRVPRWDASFQRGDRVERRSDGVCVHRCTVRRETTRFLSADDADGWDVVVGAVELARIWALDDTTVYDELGDRLDIDTRMRLAVCLGVSWKFQRSLCSIFQPQFVDEEEVRHTLELAFVARQFMDPDEARSLGPWPDAVVALAQLQSAQLHREVDLLLRRSVWSCLTRNAQALCEPMLEEMQASGQLDGERLTLLRHRALVPFFVRVALLPRRSLYSVYGGDAAQMASALLCCVMLCLDHSATARKRVASSLVAAESGLAAMLITAAYEVVIDPHTRHASLLWDGCYGDAQWPLARFVSRGAIRRLYRAAQI
tara:strand:- start:14389 stop:15747 length:1359 start_codon:yes stop_codon:yes gene_type:complete